jgi:hypothetical protein|tara:strand:+ start:186 stop:980 length:795 start_codon:yes stop_codon:yes gene_type:complete
MPDYTLTFSETSKGWPSFYSYLPEYMVGMNNYLYSFSGGNIYQHNSNEVRNNYYGVQSFSEMTSVFNEEPLTNKIFKTVNLESNAAWAASLETDLPNTGLIDLTWFVKKEGDWFAFIRSSGGDPAALSEYALRSMNGISQSASVTGTATVPIINFDLTVNIGNIISIGDNLYSANPPYTGPTLIGRITAIEVDLVNSINRITVDATVTGGAAPTLQDSFILYIKNQSAESHGLLGHYMKFVLQNNATIATELFAVESEVMKSNP